MAIIRDNRGALLASNLSTYLAGAANTAGTPLDTMEITNWHPPYECDVLHIGRIIRGTGSFELVSNKKRKKDGTIFNWSEEIIAPAIFVAILKPFILLGVRISLRRFARLVERSAR
jgi:hypothetical protein